jgi:hypothetical protein
VTSSRVAGLLHAGLWTIAVVCAIWPAYRLVLDIEIDVNEGWNAYHADAVFGPDPLYPPQDALVVNNYPPLSFMVVAGLARITGDAILAGRLLSFVSTFAVAIAIALCIRRLGGGRTSAAVGAAFYLATMVRFFTSYVGMNDPHLFGQAVMSFAFLGFLHAWRTGGTLAFPIALMTIAGFVKHNQWMIPVVAFIWTSTYGWRRAAEFPIGAAAGLTVGFLACYAAFGVDFFRNLLAPRIIDWKHSINAIGHLQWLAVGLAAWAYTGTVLRAQREIRLCNLLVVAGMASFFIQKSGDGVAHNAMFDLLFAVSIGVGLVYEHAAVLPAAAKRGADGLRVILLAAICIRLLASTRTEVVRLFFDRGFHAEIAARERATATTVMRTKEVVGGVFGDVYPTYRAGKPFLVDKFNLQQRIFAGRLPPDILLCFVKQNGLAVVEADRNFSWTSQFRPDR